MAAHAATTWQNFFQFNSIYRPISNPFPFWPITINIQFSRNFGNVTSNITLPGRDIHKFFCHLQSNVFDAASFIQTNHVVHWNAPREDIFFCVASWFFCITWCSFTTCLSSRGILTALFIMSNASKKSLQICPDHILSSPDKQWSCWQFYGGQKSR